MESDRVQGIASFSDTCLEDAFKNLELKGIRFCVRVLESLCSSIPVIYYRLHTSPRLLLFMCVSWFVGNADRCLWSWAYLVFVARPRVSTDVVDSARFLCVAAAGAPSALALLVAASPLLPPAPAASVLPALGSCCSAPAPAAGSTPRVFDLSLRPLPTVLALVVSALSPAWGVVALAMSVVLLTPLLIGAATLPPSPSPVSPNSLEPALRQFCCSALPSAPPLAAAAPGSAGPCAGT